MLKQFILNLLNCEVSNLVRTKNDKFYDLVEETDVEDIEYINEDLMICKHPSKLGFVFISVENIDKEEVIFFYDKSNLVLKELLK